MKGHYSCILITDRDRLADQLDKLRLNAEIAVRFAIALKISTDELLTLHKGNGKSRPKATAGSAPQDSPPRKDRIAIRPERLGLLMLLT